jgi:predicted permease
MGWLRRLGTTLRHSKATDAFDEEARFHIELRIEELVRQGMPPDDARREAHRHFGSVTHARERTRDANTLPWLADGMQDLRYAARQLRRNPGFALTAILTLAIGIGANTALFGVVNELLLQPLPVSSPRDLVLFNWLEGRKSMRTGMDGVRTKDEATGRSTSTSFSYPTFRRLQETNRTLTELFAFYSLHQLNIVVDRNADVASGQYVSGNYFRGLGVGAALGRTLTDNDDRAGAPPVATITHQYWTRRFDRDPGIVGEAILINKVPFTIVGVTPEGFAGTLDVTQSPDITLPFAVEPLLGGERSDLVRPAFLWVHMIGRLRPGVSREQAVAELTPTMQQAMLEEWHQARATATRATASGANAARANAARAAGADTSRTLADAYMLRAEPGGQGLMDSRRRYAQPVLVLMGCAVLVLLIACVNIAGLLLSRGAARQKEIATRLALGAGGGRLVRQLCTESLLIAVLGAAVGLVLARWAASVLAVWRPWGGSAVLQAGLDWRLFGFCGVTAVCTGVLVGLVPAMRAARTELSQATKRTTGAASPLGRALVVAQVALSLVLLMAAGLFAGTLRNLHAVDKGFNADRLLIFRIQPQLNGYAPAESAALYTRLLERIEAIPGVRGATLSRHPLLGFSRRADGVTIEGVAKTPDASAEVNVVAANFFDMMEIPLLLGRRFDDRDRTDAPMVAVVNEQFAATHLAGSNPIGRRLWLGASAEGAPIEIVGMTRDAKYTDLRSPIRPTVYIPFQQDLPGQVSFAVRTAGDAMALVPAVRGALRELDATLPLFDVRSQAEQVEESLARETMFARLSTLLAAIAMILSAIGLYGTMAYAVAQRTAEIGLRMALGARRAEVVDMIVRQALVLVAIGVAIGVPLTLGAARLAGTVLDQMLFGLTLYDPLVMSASAAILAVVAILAALVPARAAARVDPLLALRHE